MNKEEDYASDSDQSDDDFCPDGELSAPGSEEESGEDISADEDNEEEGKVPVKGKGKKTRKTAGKRANRTKTKRRAKNDKEGEEDEEEENECDGRATAQDRRQTRQTDDTNGHGKAVAEKDEIETDEEVDKSRSDALWADFLSDVKQPAAPKKVENPTTTNTSSCKTPEASNGSQTNGSEPKEGQKVEENPPETKKIVVTKVVDFAGEAVSIQKTVNADSVKENKAIPPRGRPGMSPLLGGAQKRPASAGGGGLGSILNQLGKKKKISVLEKTALDWNSFKQDEGIEEQLQTHNKGKDGYLERQDFLQRTDLRQFEIEKSLRQTRRQQ